MNPWRRFARFNIVGLAGVGLQIGSLAVLVHVAGVHYFAATIVALALTLVHNFAWHVRWTWRDRALAGRRLPGAFLRFVAGNGLVSLVGNVALMPVLVGVSGLPPVLANLAAIIACGLMNYGIGVAVFRKGGGWGQTSKCRGLTPTALNRPRLGFQR